MIRPAIRFAKRVAVMLPGIAIAYLSVFNIFPWLNDHLPLVVALVITYALGAYVFVPGVIRLFRIIFPVDHLPLYCVTADGFASDPLNIGIIGTREQLVDVMTAAGWYRADKLTFKTGARLAISTVYGWRYDRAPMSSLYLFGRSQDEGFQIPISDTKGGRHHVRFWATTFQDDKRLSVRTINWQHRQAHVQHDRLLWVGAATRDIGITFVRHSAQLTHLVDADTNAERDLIANQLIKGKLARQKRLITLGAPYKLTNIRGWTGHLHTDGKMIILEITGRKKKPGLKARRPAVRPRSPKAK